MSIETVPAFVPACDRCEHRHVDPPNIPASTAAQARRIAAAAGWRWIRRNLFCPTCAREAQEWLDDEQTNRTEAR